MGLPNLKDNIDKILDGTPEEKAGLARSFSYMTMTPKLLKNHELIGEYFSVRYGVIARHKKKDPNHNLTAQDWLKVCNEIQRPFAIVRYKTGYRMFVNVKVNNNLVAVGIEVKHPEKDLYVNAVTTAFGHEGSAKDNDFIYVKNSLSPEQLALLDGLNYRQYLAAHEGGNTQLSSNAPQSSSPSP